MRLFAKSSACVHRVGALADEVGKHGLWEAVLAGGRHGAGSVAGIVAQGARRTVLRLGWAGGLFSKLLVV